MKLFTIFLSFAPPLPPFYTIFVSFAPPLPPILTHKVTHEEKNSILVFDRGKQKMTQKSTFPV